ncbi:MAG: hypothetical protein AAF600_20960 [Bacteroidota bacterium]
MKNSKWKGLFFLFIVLLISCKNDENEQQEVMGEVSFAINTSALGARIADQNPVSALVSIEDESGNLILSLEELNLVALGEETVTEEIQLVIGQFTVTEFLIINASNEAVYVAPLEGSKMAAYVEKPLPVSFQVGATIQESVSVEVLEVVPGSTPIDFGLVDFPIDFINLFQVDISMIKDDLPADGMVTIEGYKNRSLLWTEQIDVEGTASIHLYDNVDTIIIEAFYDGLRLEKSYTLEQIQNNPQVLFNFSDTQNFVIEVVGLDRDVDYAIGRLSSENGLHKIFFEGDEAQNLLVGNFQRIPPGTYTLVLSVFENENLITDPEARGSLYKGVESYEPIEIVLNQPRIIVQGPDILLNNTIEVGT